MFPFKRRVHLLLGTVILATGEGKPVTYEYINAGGFTKINAVFDLTYEAVDVQTNAVVSSNEPRFGVRLVDLTTYPIKGDIITPDDGTNRRFIVREVQEDGQGGAYLFAKLDKPLRNP